MKSFFTSFFAAILALFVFSFVGVLLLIGFAAAVSSDEPTAVPTNAVLVIDLADNFTEKEVSDPFTELMNPGAGKVPRGRKLQWLGSAQPRSGQGLPDQAAGQRGC